MADLDISIFPEWHKIKAYPKACIYAFLDQKNKKIYLSYSKNFLYSLARNIEQFEDKNHVCFMDRNILDLSIIETIEDEKDLRIRYRYWEEFFRKSGYIFYRNIKPVNYKTRIDIMKKVNEDRNLLAVTLISNNSRTKLVVGLFEKMDEAQGFIDKHYNGSILKVVYSDNSLTKEYLKWMATKL